MDCHKMEYKKETPFQSFNLFFKVSSLSFLVSFYDKGLCLFQNKKDCRWTTITTPQYDQVPASK